MAQHRKLIALGLALALAPLAVQAQEPAAAPIGLQVDGGSVLVSSGGEFVQAAPGQAVEPGHRVMLAEGARASLDYGNGCRKAMSEPGVYTVTAVCNAASTQRGYSTGTVVAAAAAGVAVIAAVAGGGGSDDPTPVSR
ncbi:hypothetical protein [Luteimonas sp. MC1895]|uniref:hypothetical protein n=1 Tax=Luteimonas sp. MC1895 TaxID=2819513 RepID=UPI0018F06A72|nr:hypothetical protein [Luteimonas sp. MC1895]MBJ6978108.1 hypothetical protein [Luteimonas sp. MC1895]